MHALLPSNAWRVWELIHDRDGVRGRPGEPPLPPLPQVLPRTLPPCPTCGHAAPIDDEDPAVASAGPSD